MQSGMHTKCIQAHKKSKKREILPSTSSYTTCLFIFYCPRFTDDHLLLFVFSGIHGPHQASLPVLLDHSRLPSHTTCMRCMHQKAPYALYVRTQLRN